MTEQVQTVTNDAPFNPDIAPVDEGPVSDVGSEASAEPSGEDPAAQPPEPKAEPGKVDETPPWLKAEITKERNRRRAAEEETQRLKEQVDRLTRAIEPKTEEPASKPKREDFFDPDEYEAARDAWVIQEAEKRIEAKTTRSSQEQAQARAIEETQKAWSAQVEAAKKAHPDFEEVVYSEDFPCTTAMMKAVVKAHNGAEVAYHLATNPDEAVRISKLDGLDQVIEIGALSATLRSKPANVSRAPAPIRPLGNDAPAVSKDAADETEAEYFARRSATAKANRERLY